MEKTKHKGTTARSIFLCAVAYLRAKRHPARKHKGANQRCFSALCLCAFVFLSALASPPQSDVEKKIDALLARMTLEEKLGQLQQLDGEANGNYRPEHLKLVREGLLGSTLNVRGAKQTNELQRVAVEESRLKIPLLFGFDVIHGYRTIFPVPLGEAASWDPATVERAAAVAAAEAGAAGVRWTFAPMLDIARDPRWGRIVEGAGEDPYLGSAMARARVRGFQGADLRTRQSRSVRQALGRLRRGRRWARLQYDRYIGGQVTRGLFPPIQSGSRGRRRDFHERVQ